MGHRPRAKGIGMFGVAMTILVAAVAPNAFAAPSTKAKDRRAWSFNIVQRPAPALFVPVTARAPTALAVARPVHERTLAQEIHPGDPVSMRSLKLIVDADSDGNARNATIEITSSKAARTLPLGSLAVHESLVLASLELVDVDFDGYLDLRVLKERGATWTKHAYFLYEKSTDSFVASPLAQQISRIANVTVEPKRERLTTQRLDTVDPSYASYAVIAGALKLERECTVTRILGDAAEGSMRARIRTGEKFREVRYPHAPLLEALGAACERVH
jgi:hypothetical protein